MPGGSYIRPNQQYYPWDGTSRNLVWDVGTLSWISMQQPVINTDNLTVDGALGVLNASDVRINPAKEETLLGVAGLVPAGYDYVSCSYTGSNLTGVVYKTGGAGGTTVATLTLTYDANDNLISVTKT